MKLYLICETHFLSMFSIMRQNIIMTLSCTPNVKLPACTAEGNSLALFLTNSSVFLCRNRALCFSWRRSRSACCRSDSRRDIRANTSSITSIPPKYGNSSAIAGPLSILNIGPVCTQSCISWVKPYTNHHRKTYNAMMNSNYEKLQQNYKFNRITKIVEIEA